MPLLFLMASSVNILLSKMECIGTKGTELRWFKSYLDRRKQVVHINNIYSNLLNIDYGVILGSTLGPTLSSTYINNLNKLPISGTFFIFADDTAVVFSDPTWEHVYRKAASNLSI